MSNKLLLYLIIIMCYIDGNSSKPRISKMHNVQETQKKGLKQTGNCFAFFFFLNLMCSK